MKLIEKISSSVGENLRLKSFTILVVLSATFSQQALGQFTDDFSDGDFTNAPSWSSDVPANWVISETGQLKSNSSVPNSSFFISVPSSQAYGQWEFFTRLEFNTSGVNYADIYLVSEKQNLHEAGNNGYFVRIGGTPDEVSLFKVTSGVTSIMINGVDGITNKSNNTLKIKITRDENDLWTLSRDVSGTGNAYVDEGSFTDNTFTSGNFFGIRIQQSTASFHGKHFFDDFYVGDIIVDSTPPEIQTVNVISSNELEVVFSEEISSNETAILTNYFVDQNIGNPISADISSDQKTVRLVFSSPFPNGITSTLTITAVTDLLGNAITSANAEFLFFQPVRASWRDIIITEIFPDPSPSVGLPEAEFIEIYNHSTHPFDLAGWKYTDGNSSGNLSSLIFLPGQYLILTTSSARTSYSVFGNVMSVSPFPSLNNAGDYVVLKDHNGVTIDSVAYSSTWYKNDDKEDGGWSLERIDPEDYCKGSLNWKASEDPSGGTPGRQNSVLEIIPDVTGPRLLSVSRTGEGVITLQFDERLDQQLPTIEQFTIQPEIPIVSVDWDESLTKLILTLSHDVDSSVNYLIHVENISDCPGNVIEADAGSIQMKLDTMAPILKSVRAISLFTIEVSFSERIDLSTAPNESNYQIENNNPQSVIISSDAKTITVTFEKAFVNGAETIIHISNISDRAGNTAEEITTAFMFFEPVAAKKDDIIITEIFADPTPVIGLPEAEFIEIFNRSESPFDLNGWKLLDGNSSVTLPSKIFLPGEYLIICSRTQAQNFSVYGKVLGISNFPSLANAGEPLVLKDTNGNTIDSVNYAVSWYRDDEKKDGGWSLELIDPDNVCAESENWIAAESEQGGTPGKQNSVFANKPDLTGPQLLSVIALTKDSLQLVFNEKLEKQLPSIENFYSEPSLTFSSVSFTDQSLRSLIVTLVIPLQVSMEYKLVVSDIFDCAGNVISGANSYTFALPETAEVKDLVINEILFNPRATGVDFVEVYNRSAKFINLKNWKLANLTDDTVINAKTISASDLIIRPGEYMVFTENPNVLKGEYINGKEKTFREIDLPSFPDKEGSVALVTHGGEIIDSFVYTEDFHSPFLKDEEGVSLERISFEISASDPRNWKSASSATGFATPGYMNSNTRAEIISEEAVVVDPEIFVPIYGQPDFAQINFDFEQGGYVANVKIFDRQGRVIKQLANNELLGANGFFRWDGDDASGRKARVGPYMIWFEVFDQNGQLKTFRKRVVIADQF